MVAYSSMRCARRRIFYSLLVATVFLFVPMRGQAPPTQSERVQPPPSQSSTSQSSPPPKTYSRPPSVPASQQPSTKGRHPAETKPGRLPHGSDGGRDIGTALAAASAGVLIGELIGHHSVSPEKVSHDGPQVPKEFDMSGFAIKGLVYPNWPVVLDFMIDSPGYVLVEIITDKRRYRAIMQNTPNRRGYAIVRLPPNFGNKLETAIYRIRAVPPGANKPAPALRAYGLGAGERAVGSVAIDELTFQPATIHPKANEVADYGFHAHSAFDDVRAEFVFTGLYNGRVLVQKDHEEKLSPVPEGERARGTWKGEGKAGEHMLQIRAWRGLKSGGDWVVAWSPDIVEVIK
jgi:hypothetical protein